MRNSSLLSSVVYEREVISHSNNKIPPLETLVFYKCVWKKKHTNIATSIDVAFIWDATSRVVNFSCCPGLVVTLVFLGQLKVTVYFASFFWQIIGSISSFLFYILLFLLYNSHCKTVFSFLEHDVCNVLNWMYFCIYFTGGTNASFLLKSSLHSNNQALAKALSTSKHEVHQANQIILDYQKERQYLIQQANMRRPSEKECLVSILTPSCLI